MAFSYTWNATFESAPADTEATSLGAGRIRDLKKAISERGEIDHNWNGGTDDGQHKKITFGAPLGADPTNAADLGFLYTKDVSAKAELFWEDEDGNIWQMTSGGVLKLDSVRQPQADVASAATTNIGAAASRYVRITGTTTITAFDTVSAGIWRKVRFAGALTLTHNATSLILPSNANITTAANDTAEFVSLGSGNWLCLSYKKQSGEALISSPSGLTLLASASPSAAASVDITSAITATYKTYLLIFENLIPATDDVELWLRTSTDNGSTFDSGVTAYAYALGTVDTAVGGISIGDTGNDRIIMTDTGPGQAVGNLSSEGISGRVWISDPLNAAVETRMQFETYYRGSDSDYYAARGMGARATAADVDAVQLLFQSGNIASGEVRFYGVVNS